VDWAYNLSEEKSVYIISMWKVIGKWWLGKSRWKWKSNIKI